MVSNPKEHLNTAKCAFLAGKMKVSYQIRFEVAALFFNSNGANHGKLHEVIFGRSSFHLMEMYSLKRKEKYYNQKEKNKLCQIRIMDLE